MSRTQTSHFMTSQHQSLVSVVMNCYNGEKYLREAVDSVFAQTYQNWEIIFWDNASTDNTRAIATSYDTRLKYFRADINTPLGSARNKALKKATGKYIAFLDSDDVYLPHKLKRQVDLMESGEYGLVYGGTIIINEDGNQIKRRKMNYNGGRILCQLLKRYEILMCSVMLRRDVLEKCNLEFDESMGYCPDYNLFMKIAAQYPLGVLHEFVVKYRRVATSLSKKTFHLVAKEVGETLDELQRLCPDILESDKSAMIAARAKLNFYDAVNHISLGDYLAARYALKPILHYRWQYPIIYLVLFFPFPKKWVLRFLNR